MLIDVDIYQYGMGWDRMGLVNTMRCDALSCNKATYNLWDSFVPTKNYFFLDFSFSYYTILYVPIGSRIMCINFTSS